jgi:hypothetical protein
VATSSRPTTAGRNRCQIQSHLPLREAITQQRAIGEVLDVLVESKTTGDGSRLVARRLSVAP